MNHDSLYTPAEAAEHLRVTKASILKWVKKGDLSASRLSTRTILIRGADLDSFVESKRIPAGSAIEVDAAFVDEAADA